MLSSSQGVTSVFDRAHRPRRSMAHELTPAPSTRLASRTRVRHVPAQPARRMRPDAFERLFEEHAERLFSFLAYRTGNRALAEDLLSETFERVLRTVGADSPSQQSDAGMAAVEHRDELQRALATLGEDEREALALRFGADLKLRDVARLLGDGESAVEGRIYRALRKLRAELDRSPVAL